MSECNHCSLKWMKDRRKKTGEAVHRVQCVAYGGWDLFVTKKGEKPQSIGHAVKGVYEGVKDTRCVALNARWAAWMQEIGSSCEC